MISTKVRAILAAIAVLGALTLLAISLPTIEFRGAQGFDFALDLEQNTDIFETDEVSSGDVSNTGPFDILMLVFRWVAVPLGVLYALFTADGRRHLGRTMVNGVIIGMMIYAGIRVIEILTDIMKHNLAAADGGGAGPLSLADMPPIVVVGTSTVIALLLFGLLWMIVKRVSERDEPKLDIGATAQIAIDELASGADLRMTILQCYRSMVESVQKLKGVERKEHMTPREFEMYLIRFGLPTRDVERLTRLFERSRYGTGSVNDRDRQEASDCLQAIVNACGGF